MMGRYIVLIAFVFLVEGVFGDAEEVKSVMEGDPVILNTGVTKGPNDMVLWYFNDTLIAVIDGICCFYDGIGGMFRDRLEVDYETGSLNITNITTEHAGHYEAEIIRSESSGKSESLNIIHKCNSTKITKKNINSEDIIITFILTVSASDSGKNKNEAQIEQQDKEKTSSGLSSAAVIGIIVGVLLAVAAVAVVVGVVKFTYCSIFDKKKNKQVLKQMSEDEYFFQTQNEKV